MNEDVNQQNARIVKQALDFSKLVLPIANRLAKAGPSITDAFYKYRGVPNALKPGLTQSAGTGGLVGGAFGAAAPTDDNSGGFARLKNTALGAITGAAGLGGVKAVKNFQAFRPNIAANQQALTTLRTMGMNPGLSAELGDIAMRTKGGLQGAEGGIPNLFSRDLWKKVLNARNEAKVSTLSGTGLEGQVLPKMTGAMRQLGLDTINAGQVVNPHMIAGLNSPGAQKMLANGGVKRVYGTAESQLKPISPEQKIKLQNLEKSIKVEMGAKPLNSQNLSSHLDDNLDDNYFKWLGLNRVEAGDALEAMNNPMIRKLRYVLDSKTKPFPFDVKLQPGVQMPPEGFYKIPAFSKVQQRRFNNIYGQNPVS